jgi:ABC-2 type transport system permease protein
MRTGFRLPPTVGACVEKEWIYLKRSGAQLYGLVAPLFLVFILARRNGIFSNTPMLLPYAVSYVMLGLLANLYNVLGADGPGFNLYLLAPVRLRDVMLSKNLVNGGVIAVEVLLACVAVAMINGGVPPVAMLTATLSWAVFATLSNMAVGNLRSIFSPKRFELGKVRRATTAKGSGFISLGIFAVTVAAGIATIMLCRFLGVLWVATPVFVVLAGGALAGYVMVLGRIDSIALERREDLAEALTKTG